MPAEVHLFVCRADNYGCLIHDPATSATAAIDVPEAAPVLAAAEAKGWTISHVLVTHHHGDHVDGIPEVKARTGATIIANRTDAHRIPLVDAMVDPGGTVTIGALVADIIDTPGHTVGHVAFHFASERILFAGDTLFSLGCGRLFEGTPAMMRASLERLAALPGDTQVYCGHEYTASNGRFAATVDPANKDLASRLAEVTRLRAAGLATLPTTIAQEKATNPFLRAHEPAIAAAIGKAGAAPDDVFATLRDMKNRA